MRYSASLTRNVQPRPSRLRQARTIGAGRKLNSLEEVPAALDPKQKIFIVGSNLDLVSDAGECAVTPGDVLLRTGSAPDENNKVSVSVVSSKKGDCPVDTTSDVEVTELQEMHNQFREKMDTGLKSLAENSGKNGLPGADY